MFLSPPRSSFPFGCLQVSNMLRNLMFAAAVLAACASTKPEQIHISLTGDVTEMHVAWVTTSSSGSSKSTVQYGTTPSLGQTASGDPGFKYDDSGKITTIYTYDVTLTGLTPSTTYFYKIDGDDTVLNFTSAGSTSRTYAALADFGLVNDVSIKQLIAEAQNGAFDVVLHAGDLAYNLEDSKGATGNGFMNQIQPVASRVPYMATCGNHEADDDTFSEFKTRFYGLGKTAGARSGSNSSTWYSFNDGLVHFVFVDTELWAYDGKYAPKDIAAQQAWLEQDLASVDRSKTPWIIAAGHKQRWMDSTNFTDIETTLLKYGGNLYIAGHTHNYQRIKPNAFGEVETSCIVNPDLYQDCKTMVTMIVGSPGCRELISNGTAPGDQLEKVFLSYGYSHIVVNETALKVTWEEVGQRDLLTGALVRKSDKDYDEFYITRSA
jgi:hypothetical protein